MNQIDIHELSGLHAGLEIMRIPEGADAAADGLHRDDHYNFLVLETGTMEFMVDFQNLSLAAGEIYFIKPGQVHRRLSHQGAAGWFLAPDISLLSPDIRNVFESSFNSSQAALLEAGLFTQAVSIINLIHLRSTNANPRDTHHIRATTSLFQSFLNILAGCHYQDKQDELSLTRPEQLRNSFKNLVSANFKALKTPSDYAARLNVSVNYLNEVVKRTTGFPVTYWIMHEIIFEAKRLLVYTNRDIKVIAYELGYIDPAYFSRLFKKHTGQSPLSFRIKNVE